MLSTRACVCYSVPYKNSACVLNFHLHMKLDSTSSVSLLCAFTIFCYPILCGRCYKMNAFHVFRCVENSLVSHNG